ncbi:MAG TPA: MEDS domain-containing protein, partial [Myxococcota bacterium]|nr:MEDS domain-containing protein [Myxococcota bacterium]
MTAQLDAHRAARGHAVQMYEDERFLLDTLVRFAGGGLGAGDPVIVIATEAHLARLAERLTERQFDLLRARTEGRYVELDAVTTLEKLMVDGRPDHARFAEIIAGPIALASKLSSGPVRAFGEMVALLVADLRYDAAIEL